MITLGKEAKCGQQSRALKLGYRGSGIENRMRSHRGDVPSMVVWDEDESFVRQEGKIQHTAGSKNAIWWREDEGKDNAEDKVGVGVAG